jgi:hypothetical protein
LKVGIPMKTYGQRKEPIRYSANGSKSAISG